MKIALQAPRRLDVVHPFGPNTSLAQFMPHRPAGQVTRAQLLPAVTGMPAPVLRNAYRFGTFVLVLDRGMLLGNGGVERALRPKSFALLHLLVENAGRLLSQDTILETLWPGTCITENSLSQCVRDIRRALGPTDEGMLRTMPRRGYLFMPQVTPFETMAILYFPYPGDGDRMTYLSPDRQGDDAERLAPWGQRQRTRQGLTRQEGDPLERNVADIAIDIGQLHADGVDRKTLWWCADAGSDTPEPAGKQLIWINFWPIWPECCAARQRQVLETELLRASIVLGR